MLAHVLRVVSELHRQSRPNKKTEQIPRSTEIFSSPPVNILHDSLGRIRINTGLRKCTVRSGYNITIYNFYLKKVVTKHRYHIWHWQSLHGILLNTPITYNSVPHRCAAWEYLGISWPACNKNLLIFENLTVLPLTLFTEQCALCTFPQSRVIQKDCDPPPPNKWCIISWVALLAITFTLLKGLIEQDFCLVL